MANIDLRVLASVVNILDTACKRGAFEGNEMLTIGQIREHLAQLVNKGEEPEPEAESEQQAPKE